MKEDTRNKDCEVCLKRFEEIIADLHNQIKILNERIKELEERLNRDSHNSNKPPSSDDHFKKQTKSLRTKSGKKLGGQPGHEGHTLKKADNPDKIIRHKVTKCTCCGENLENIEAGKIESRQIFDIPLIKVEVTEHQAEEKKCPNCGTKNKAEFPEGVTNITQYGNNIKAFAVWLKNAGFVSYERIVELFKEFFGIEISQATLQSFDLVTAGNLENFENDVKAKLFQERVIHADESGIRIEGELNWVHSISSEGYTLYFLHEKRGGEAMKAMGILPEYKGTVIHDGWASYWDFSFRHGLCNAHHLRELVWAYEEEGQDWAWDFGGLLKKIKWSKEDHFPLSSDEIDYFLSEYNRIIEEGYAANPITIKVRGKKRGKPKRGKVLCLLDRLKEHKDSVTLFMREKDVPFDNNLAERDIRMIKVQQKVSGTFRSRAGGKAFCRIRSLISTARKQCYKAFQAILDALKGNRFSFMAE